jgi:hypothetical protein
LHLAVGRQAFEQGVDARARCGQARRRLSRSAVTAMQLLFDQGAGALEFLVPQHQAIDAFD